MKCLSVLIPDADVRLPVACCLAVSPQVVVHGLAINPGSSLKHSKFFASFEEYEGKFDINGWLQRIGEIIAERQIDVVLPIAEFAVKMLGEYRHALSWSAKLPPLPSPHTLDLVTNKATFADFLDSSAIPHPPTVVVSTRTSARDRLSALRFPVLAKPSCSSGGIGIRRFEDLDSIIGFLAEQPNGERWVIQTFIEGHDLAVNVLCRDGRVVAATVQNVIKTSSEPFHPAIGIEFGDHPAAMKIAEALINKLGWSGVANIDMRVDARRKIPMVLEINGRYWLSLLGSLNAGVNFPLLACEMCLGTQRTNNKPHTARYFYGKELALLSLVGGGAFRIRPNETDLRYLDPLPMSSRLAQSAAGRLRTLFFATKPSGTDNSFSGTI